MGYRFRLHRGDLPGSPDLVFPKHRKVVLVHGCFWHQHEGCRLKRQPRTRLDYWLPKLNRNVARDAEVRERLKTLGWEPLVIWECETTNHERVESLLANFLNPSGHQVG
jgi:DNA mismatch endonuclease (patch repair protein)